MVEILTVKKTTMKFYNRENELNEIKKYYF